MLKCTEYINTFYLFFSGFGFWVEDVALLIHAPSHSPLPFPPALLPLFNAEICSVDCGSHGVCMGGTCRCEEGWTGTACSQRACHPRCAEHGTCKDGKCECSQGWNGEHCTIGRPRLRPPCARNAVGGRGERAGCWLFPAPPHLEKLISSNSLSLASLKKELPFQVRPSCCIGSWVLFQTAVTSRKYKGFSLTVFCDGYRNGLTPRWLHFFLMKMLSLNIIFQCSIVPLHNSKDILLKKMPNRGPFWIL